MSGSLLQYLLTISLLLVLAALAAEWLLIRLRRPARGSWAVALLLSVVLPLLPSRPAPAPEMTLPAVTSSPPLAADVAVPVTSSPGWSLDFDLPVGWLYLASFLTGGVLLTGWTLLALRARRWPSAVLDGSEVLRAPATGPAVVGFLQPRIVVPAWAFELPPDQRRMLLAHEQSHIDARDPLLLLGAALVVVAMPWNPLLWFALHRLRGAIEIDCDARVLAGGEAAEGYARCLIDTVTLAAAGPAPVVGALSLSSSILERRVDLMLRTGRPLKLFSVAAAIAVIALVTSAFMKAPPVSASVELDAKTMAANAAALEMSSKRTANYYTRLTEGKLANPTILYGAFYDNWTPRDPDKQGEGC
jgi:hypothetical protein